MKVLKSCMYTLVNFLNIYRSVSIITLHVFILFWCEYIFAYNSLIKLILLFLKSWSFCLKDSSPMVVLSFQIFVLSARERLLDRVAKYMNSLFVLPWAHFEYSRFDNRSVSSKRESALLLLKLRGWWFESTQICSNLLFIVISMKCSNSCHVPDGLIYLLNRSIINLIFGSNSAAYLMDNVSSNLSLLSILSLPDEIFGLLNRTWPGVLVQEDVA